MKNNYMAILILVSVLLLSACATGGGKKAATQTVFQPVVQVVTRNYQPVFTSTAPDVAGINLAYHYNFTVFDFDAGPQPLSMTVNAADTCGGALTDNGDGTGNYTFTPATAQLGTQCIVGLTASDGETPTNQNTTVDIGSINAPPYFTSTAPASATESVIYTYNIIAADDNVPAQALTLTKGTYDTCGGTVTDNGNGTATYSFTPSEAEGGSICLISMMVTDSMAASADQNTLVTIIEDNKPPVNNAPASVVADELTLVSFSMNPTDPDIPVQLLTCSIVTNTCPGGALTGCTFNWIPTEAQGPNAGCAVTTRVSDGSLTSDVTTTVTVNEVNVAPVNNAPANVSGNELTLISFSINPTDSDIPAQALSCSMVTNNCPGGALTGCTFNWTPTEAQGPTACSVTTRASDGALTNDATTMVIVNEVNVAPVNNAPANVSGDELTLISFNINPTDPDIPAQALSCSLVTNTCTGGALIGCTFQWTPTEAQGPMACSVTTRVSDGALNADATTAVTVNEVNVAPTWTTVPSDITISVGSAYNKTNGVADDVDNGETLTCLSGGTTCTGFTPSVSGSGKPVNCNVSFTSSISETCRLRISVADNGTPALTIGNTITIRIEINRWTWMSGSNGRNQSGVYGTKGTPNPANVPGSRYGSVSWTDSSGNFWLFGGGARDSVGTFEYINDLWKYDGTNWTWMHGSNFGRQSGIYGTKGAPAPANTPGGRYGSISWKDSSGNLWLFGGNGYDAGGTYGASNDLWKYNIATGYWTWVSGSSTGISGVFYGVWGTKGIPDPANIPSGRNEGVSWIDGSGNLWLFGGIGDDSVGAGPTVLNDLWKYDGTNWTWMSGSNLCQQSGVYGTKGTPDPANVPGARYGFVSWIDASGDLWLFGGYGSDSTASLNILNDLWKYNITTGYWTWVSGSNIVGQAGVYGYKGIPDPANIPGARYSSVSWIDASGDLWLFGGAVPSMFFPDCFYDLWKYNIATGYWTWISGSDTKNQLGVYGTKGTPDAANIPGARQDSVSWIDNTGNLYLFGGTGYDSAGYANTLNDLWKYAP